MLIAIEQVRAVKVTVDFTPRQHLSGSFVLLLFFFIFILIL